MIVPIACLLTLVFLTSPGRGSRNSRSPRSKPFPRSSSSKPTIPTSTSFL